MPTPQEQRKKDGDFVNFRKLLITRCQLEFEKNSVDETKRNEMVQIIDECTDSVSVHVFNIVTKIASMCFFLINYLLELLLHFEYNKFKTLLMLSFMLRKIDRKKIKIDVFVLLWVFEPKQIKTFLIKKQIENHFLLMALGCFYSILCVHYTQILQKAITVVIKKLVLHFFILQEKKKELLANLEDHDRRIRMKSVGNIRFIGKKKTPNLYNILLTLIVLFLFRSI